MSESVCFDLDLVQDLQPPKLSNENILINDLFREYLAFNKYRSTLSVFHSGAFCRVPSCEPGVDESRIDCIKSWAMKSLRIYVENVMRILDTPFDF
jgi:hypothetical protein